MLLKIYLILLIISGLGIIMTGLKTKAIQRKYHFKRVRKTSLEEQIFNIVKLILMWIFIFHGVINLLIDIFANEDFVDEIILKTFTDNPNYEIVKE